MDLSVDERKRRVMMISRRTMMVLAPVMAITVTAGCSRDTRKAPYRPPATRARFDDTIYADTPAPAAPADSARAGTAPRGR